MFKRGNLFKKSININNKLKALYPRSAFEIRNPSKVNI